MKITTTKQYENRYTIAFGYNGKQFGESDEKTDKNTNESHDYEAYERFVKDMGRYTSVPTPEYNDCKFTVIRKTYTEDESKYRVYLITIQVTWQYITEK